MSFLVKDLLGEHHTTVTVRPEDSLQVALTRMTEYEYSQLPIVDGENRYLGMVTSDSILRALKTFGVTPASLLVRDAKTKVSTFREDDDLFEILDDLRDSYAVPILDEERRVIGVVTGYDATEYFRRRTEDMMFVEDIELTLRDHIEAVHSNGSGELDSAALQQSIQHCARGASTNRKRFFAALQKYVEHLEQHNEGTNLKVNPALALDIFSQVFESDEPRSLDKLTFADYVELLFSKDQWQRYARVFEPLPSTALRSMLDAVRETRNALAHFRADVTLEQRDRLKFCRDWFRDHPAVRLLMTVTAEVETEPSGTSSPNDSGSTGEPASSMSVEERELPDEIVESHDSRYAPLALFLMRQPRDRDRLSLSFLEVENIIQDPLPSFARQHRSFWSNDSVSHPQSQQWLDVDWRVASVDMSNEVVVFSRIKEREKQYIDFFSTLLVELRGRIQFAIRNASPDGHSWITIAGVPEQGPQVAMLAFSFTRNRRFRIELYIDTGERNRNKRIYDHLYARSREIKDQLLPEHDDNISNPLSLRMSWERLDEKRASRIALYCPASITDDEMERNLTIAWAASATLEFQKIMNQLVTEAVREGV